jgi:hypothetical protein
VSLLRSSAPDCPVPPATSSRRRRGAGLGVLALAALVLAGCQVDNTPKTYDDITKANFLATCTGDIPNAATTTVLASRTYCECAYETLVRLVPYDDDARADYPGYPSDAPTFQALEASLNEDPGRFSDLPENVRNELEACPREAGPQPGGTTPAGTTPEGTTPEGTTPPVTDAPGTTLG